MGPDISLPLAFVENLDLPVLIDVDQHHFEKVLRVREGERISISDARGSWRECNFGTELTELGEIKNQSASKPKLGIGFCPLKGGRSDGMVAKLTEIGIDYMTPFFAERTIVEFDEEKLVSQIKRWKRIVRESSMQSKRVHLPEITSPSDFVSLSIQENVGHCVIKNDVIKNHATKNGEDPPQDLSPQDINTFPEVTFLLVGPEGGWSKGEYSYIQNPVSLTPNVLRSDTAAILAGAFLVQRRGGNSGR